MPSKGEYPRGIRLGYNRIGGSQVEFPDRGSCKLDKWGVLMDCVGGVSQLDHTGAVGRRLWRFLDRASAENEQRHFSCRTLSSAVSSAR